MTIETKENLSLNRSISPEILTDTEKSLSNVEKETRINFFKKAGNRIKNVFFGNKEEGQANFLNNKLSEKQENVSSTSENIIDKKINKEINKKQNTNQESQETTKTGSDKISDEMFEQLLKMEGSQKHIAKTATYFGEKFTTGPYGMVYKLIDSEGNLLKKPIPFKEGEQLTEKRSKDNARAYYNKKAKEWKNILDGKGYTYTQCMLDSLVSASGGTAKATKNLQNYVLSHWDNKNDISKFMSNFATTAAGNGKRMPGLVRRRKFESNWFMGNKVPFKNYKA